jgi:NAD(P)-dependent dehydrogenase (short-subunit alcohol dehydrogenase family)
MATKADSLSLENKVAIVTGSGKENGIGAGIAFALARAGARVVINHVSATSAPRAAEVSASIEKAAGKGAAIVVQADVSSAEGAKKLVDETLGGFGVDHIDILGKSVIILQKYTPGT